MGVCVTPEAGIVLNLRQPLVSPEEDRRTPGVS